MNTHLKTFLREIRRWFSRSEWVIRVLGLSRSTDDDATGLIMIQVDGLSYHQFKKAIAEGRMRFTEHTLLRQGELYSLYSGLPSSTPAMQGELFFGVKTAVPTFSFLDREKGMLRVMYEPDDAYEIEQSLFECDEGLLQGGSAYCNIYTGGAEESHFCASSLGWGGLLRAANPFVILFFFITNIGSLVRTAALFVLEIFVAAKDFVMGFIEGRDFFKELKFIAARVVIGVLLRELMTIGAKIDIARGLPIIHLNFIGYDEQAHRRGPSSRLAHWSLKGIDHAIRRIYRAADHSPHRRYVVWLYSDHGQEDVLPYPNLNNRSIDDAVTEAFDLNLVVDDNASSAHGIESQRARLLGGKKIQRMLPTYEDSQRIEPMHPTVTAMGPLGQIYSPRTLSEAERNIIGRNLNSKARIPLVLSKESNGSICAWLNDKQLSLPSDGAEVFGHNHPFLEDLITDMIDLCQHKDAGDFVICGWHADTQPITFRLESGSHAGPGTNETHAFALLPKNTPLTLPLSGYLRPMDLRTSAKQLLARYKA